MENNLKILVVDDSSEDRETCSRLLSKCLDSNIDLLQCDNGQDALKVCAEEIPDCLLLDYLLPDMDGLEFLSCVTQKGFPNPIIMMTGQGSESIAVEAMKSGAHDYLIKNSFTSEALYSAIVNAIEANKADETKKWKTQALVDPLTKVLNRNAYNLTIEQAIREYQRYQVPTVLVLIDIDNFKAFNDNYGHKTGDTMLHNVAASVTQSIRASDYIFRYGGEEFAVLLNKISLSQAAVVAEKIRLQVKAKYTLYNGKKLNSTISLGISALQENDTEETVFVRADKALYEAKQSGKDRVVVFSENVASPAG